MPSSKISNTGFEQSTFLSHPSFLNAFLEQVGQTGILILSPEGLIIFANKRALRLLGILEKKLIGQAFEKTINLLGEKNEPVQFSRTPIQSSLRTKGFKQITPFFCFYSSSGEKPVSVAIKATQVAEKANIIGAIVEIREATRKLNIDEMKTLFLSFAAHQLKTPSSIVRGFLELLIREGKKNFKPNQWDNIMSAFEANDQLIRLSKTLLNLTKLEGGMIEPKLSSFNAKELLNQKIASHLAVLQYKGIKTKLIHSGESSFETDSVFFSELFDILFGNAVKYSPEGSTITVSLSILPDMLRLEVIDEGEGMSEVQQSELFTNAQKANPYDNSHGLGLLIAHKYITLLGGTIGVISKPGKGSNFYITIPMPI